MEHLRFEVVFKKLAEAIDEETDNEAAITAGASQELDEFEQLRNMIAEVLEEPTVSYTTT